jgi:hypothetical protein
VNGVHKNPQTVRLAGAEPLHAESLLKFRHATAALLAGLTPQTAAALAAATPPPSAAPGPLAAAVADVSLTAPPLYGAGAVFSLAALTADGTVDRLRALSGPASLDEAPLNLALRPSTTIH